METTGLSQEPLILAIETSCDETSVAVVRGRQVLSNVISSQIALHKRWGGVVPEAAARAHVEAFLPVLQEALQGADAALEDIEAVAVTNRPGLVGALSVGVTAAKAICYSHKIPLLGISHLEGHLSSILSDEKPIVYPHISLIVSGGHTELVLAMAPGQYRLLGQTLDDAAGEAFDKGARLLGLGYPGGMAIQENAVGGDPLRYKLPKGLSGPTTDFSFSGLKTAMLRLVEREGKGIHIQDACASLQHTIVEVLVERTLLAVDENACEAVAVVGGVSANLALRQRMEEECGRRGIGLWVPPLSLCTDNAAMIGLAALQHFASGRFDDLDLDVYPQDDSLFKNS